MRSSPGCWAAYGELLAREYEDPALFAAAHRLTVDAYALQHPGDPRDRRARQSVRVHHASLYLALVLETPHAAIPATMRKLVGHDFPALPPPPAAFAITLADVLGRPEAEHVAAVRGWAEAAFQAWVDLEQPTRDLLRAI